MATYDELRNLYSNDALRKRVEVAAVLAAEAELIATPGTAAGRAWGLDVLRSPEAWGTTTLKAVLAANSGSSVAQITGATDAQIQTNVNAVKGGLINAHAGA